jgi:hypothetical protein
MKKKRRGWDDNIKTDLRKIGSGVWSGFNLLKIWSNAGFCEYCKEHSVPAGTRLNQLSNYQLFKEYCGVTS